MAVQLRHTAGARGVGVLGTAGARGVGALDIARAAGIGHDRRLLPVADELTPLLNQPGLVAGSVLAARGPGALTLATAFAAEVSRTGGWVTAVGLGRMGVSAVAEREASLDRWVFVDEPGSAAAEVLNALIGNVDVILLASGVRLAAAHSRRLRTRLRERGTVVIEVADRCAPRAGAFSPDVTVTVERAAWTGLGHGLGRLRERRAEVVAAGRGAASLPRRAVLWLPDAAGRITRVQGAIDTVSWPASVVPAQNGILAADASQGSDEVIVPLQRRAG